MSAASESEARYERLADAVEAGEYEIDAGAVEIRPDSR